MIRVTSLNLLLMIIVVNLFFLMGETKKHESKYEKSFKKRKNKCQEQLCSHIPKDFNDNCINQCISLECFDKVYANNPLEDGEYDYQRYINFSIIKRVLGLKNL